jgi:hypothetical protein
MLDCGWKANHGLKKFRAEIAFPDVSMAGQRCSPAPNDAEASCRCGIKPHQPRQVA